ncbi:MAG: helix-turn-helix domain-containing protein [Clostridiales bacterium]|jgi:transcriptional regulator with XRE-family HTH domain|nr:helix-turn-helix domain-containing protein [Clostridiales bacterium]MDR2713873.1 helix-turn-helix domain-containing protein [Clostridiales bacterium]
MNTVLGARIKRLRELKGLTQEQVAAFMQCSRQKYARLEKGLIDISYSSISTIAKIFGIKTEEITSAINITHQEDPLFRDGMHTENTDGFEIIDAMLDTFYAHRKLYNSVRQVEINE